MIFRDANVLLYAITAPALPKIERMHLKAATLLRAMAAEALEATTSEAVISEVAFILTSKRQFALPFEEAAALLRPILASPGFVWPPDRRRIHLRALEIWAERPRLGFVDALTAAHVEGGAMRLASFDGDFDGVPGIVRWEAEEG